MLTANDIMTKDVVVINDTASVAQAIALMQNQKVRSLIVEHATRKTAYGIITERDIIYRIIALDKDPSQVIVRKLVREPCIIVHPDLPVHEVAQLFAATGIQRAPVISQDQLLGVVSVTDLLMKAAMVHESQTDPLSQRIKEALLHARIVCGDIQQQVSEECAVAWDVLEELETVAS